MSKFCGNCGAQIDDTAKVCGHCGFAQTEESNVAVPGVGDVVGKAKEIAGSDKVKKLIPIAGIAVVAVVVIVILASVIGSSTGYKGVVKKFVNAVEKEDAAKIMSLLSDDEFEDEDFDEGDYEDAIADQIDAFLDYWDDKVGGDPKFSFEITDADELSDRKIDDLNEEFEEADIDIEVKKAVEVEVELTVKGDKKEKDEEYEFYLIKQKEGGWKIYYTDMLGGYYFE